VKVPENAPLLRVVVSFLLALGALVLFLVGRTPPPVAGHPGRSAVAEQGAVDRIDAGIDSVLASFGIPDRDIRKRAAEGEDNPIHRTERRVTIGPQVVPVAVNAALNVMAHRYGGRAVASENVRFRTVTIHLELGGTVVHTVILKSDPRSAPISERPPQTST